MRTKDGYVGTVYRSKTALLHSLSEIWRDDKGWTIAIGIGLAVFGAATMILGAYYLHGAEAFMDAATTQYGE